MAVCASDNLLTLAFDFVLFLKATELDLGFPFYKPLDMVHISKHLVQGIQMCFERQCKMDFNDQSIYPY